MPYECLSCERSIPKCRYRPELRCSLNEVEWWAMHLGYNLFHGDQRSQTIATENLRRVVRNAEQFGAKAGAIRRAVESGGGEASGMVMALAHAEVTTRG